MRLVAASALLLTLSAHAELRPADVEHVMVYYQPGEFGGWPANHGIWNWDNEILVGFTRGVYKDLGDRHHIDREQPELHYLARSKDGGETWEITDPGERGFLIPEGGFLHGVPREDQEAPEVKTLAEPIDFTHPGFAMTLRTTDINDGDSRLFYSYDRGDTWEGPFALPDFGAPGTAARTDYIVDGKHECMIFSTAAKANGDEGRPFAARTTDGGLTWELAGWIGPEPEGFSIMPATVRLSDTELLCAVRRREGDRRWIDAWRSHDNGKYWVQTTTPVEDCGIGNPAAMIQLEDGRLCLTYGFRGEPFSIRAKLSEDDGHTWSKDIILRDDGASRDVGYPRMVQRPDGKVVVLYYFNDAETGPERYIAATIFDPDSIR